MYKFELKILIHHTYVFCLWNVFIAMAVFLLVNLSRGIYSPLQATFPLVTFPYLAYFNISEHVCFPYRGYFKYLIIKHKRIDRKLLSEELRLLGKYPHLKNVIFLDEFIFFEYFGLVLYYHEIKYMKYSIAHIYRSEQNQRYSFTLTFHCSTFPYKQKYRFYCYPNEKSVYERELIKASQKIIESSQQ